MNLTHFCTQGVVAASAMAFCFSHAVAQRTDYNYTRPVTPSGIATNDCLVYDFAGNSVSTLRGDKLLECGKQIRDVRINPTGMSLIVLSDDKKAPVLAVFGTNDIDNQLHKFNNKKDGVPTTMAYTADARNLVVCSADSTAKTYDPRAFTRLSQFKLPYTPTDIRISSNGYYLAITDGHRVNVYNYEGQNERKGWNFDAKVNDMAFSNDNDEFAVVTDDGVVNIYDTRTFLTKKTIDDAGSGLSIAYNFDGKYMAVATSPTSITIYNLLDSDDKETITVDNGGMSELAFISDSRYNTLLAYNTDNTMHVKRMTKLAPYYGKLINEQLNERMTEWMKMLPGETLEQYQNRVNDQTRDAQRKLFEAEISTSFANDLVNMATVSLGNYDRSNSVLAVAFDNMPTIFLTVPETDLGSFNNAENLRFDNAKYGVLPNDHFELIYAEVYNKADGKTYIFSNLDRVNLNYMTSDDNVVSLEIIQQQQMEELRLQELREKIMAEAKQSNVLSDHTRITVDSRVEPDYDANGDRILNYLVNFTYEVEPEFSTVEDFAPGKYRISESGAASAMLRIVKEAFEGDFAQYFKPGKKLIVKLSGTADGSPIIHGIPYDGVYGEFIDEPVYQNGRLTGMTVTPKTGIKENEQLAFIRACAVKDFLNNNIAAIKDMNTEYSHHVSVSEDKGGEFRRITAEFTFVDAF